MTSECASQGHEVVGTDRSAPEAIAQAMALSPDLALMDIRLAQSSGIDVTRELHRSEGLRCIFVSANLDEPMRAALLPSEPIEFVGKPVMPVVLQSALRKAEALIEL
jgi:two-component system response regulator DevR